MHYYQKNIGDYRSATMHLTLLEHGVYNQLLDWYYLDERPLPTEKRTLFRRLSARSEEEQKAVVDVLQEMFTESESGWVHSRVDREIEKYRDKSSKASASGKLGGRPRKVDQTANDKANASSGKANAFDDKANAKLTKNQEPLTNNQDKDQKLLDAPSVASDTGGEKIGKAEAACQIVLDAYNAALPNCQRATVLTAKRKRLILVADKLARKVIKDKGWGNDMATFWGYYFETCARDPWKAGKVPNPNNPNWKQCIETLIDDKRFASVVDEIIVIEDAA